MNTTQTNAAWLAAKPFPHCVIEDFLHVSMLAYAEKTAASIPFHSWHQYDSPFEQKKSVCTLPDVVGPVRDFCYSLPVVSFLERLTGIQGLIADPALHGGGFHRTTAGGFLDLHLDYSHHPRLNLERVLTLIVYLSDACGSHGGKLQLWDMDSMSCQAEISAKVNRAVLFRNTPQALHGHPDPLAPDAEPRYSFACFYHAAPRPEAAPRPRALFFARPGDQQDPEKDRLRAERAGFKPS